MKTKILLVSIFAVLLMLSMPVISNLQATPTHIRTTNEQTISVNDCNLCADDHPSSVAIILEGLDELEEEGLISNKLSAQAALVTKATTSGDLWFKCIIWNAIAQICCMVRCVIAKPLGLVELWEFCFKWQGIYDAKWTNNNCG